MLRYQLLGEFTLPVLGQGSVVEVSGSLLPALCLLLLSQTRWALEEHTGVIVEL